MKLITKKRLTGIAAATAVSVGLIVGPSVAATADASAQYSSGGFARAVSKWTAGTDTMSTTDRYSDGWGSRIWWNLRGNTTNSKLDNTQGADTTQSQTLWVLPSWEFRVQACSINNGTNVGCSSWSGYSTV